MIDYPRWPQRVFRLHWLIYVLLAIVLAGLSVVALRQNNIRMGQLKAAVIEADQTGEGINPALQELGSYVFNHMNTTTQVTLASSYSRDAQALIEATRPEEDNDQVYEDARRECENPNIPLTARASCVAEYVLANSSDEQAAEIKLPNEQQYTYQFVSPTWSFDLAGVAMLASVSLLGLAGYSAYSRRD